MQPRRPVRIANCSGAMPDPGELMLVQATAGPVDAITGDYLSEANLGEHAEAFAKGEHPGYVVSAWRGLELSIDAINEKRIKVVINGGGLNPTGLAEATVKLVRERGYNLKVAVVDGDNVLPQIHELLKPDATGRLPHLDAGTPGLSLPPHIDSFSKDPSTRKIVSANAYLGFRAIRKGLEEGADIVICGRVADASPLMGIAAWWHGWRDDQFQELAGALLAGHLTECSTYSTGGNYAGFDEHETGELLDLGCPIAEVMSSGECVITKHEKLNGIVTEEVIKCQLLYELQGNIYLNSDVKADLTDVVVRQVGPNRVHVSGTKGFPPPPTTKLATFYQGGFQGEMSMNASGYATEKKYHLQETQLRRQLAAWGLLDKLDVLEFQRIGIAQSNPRTQLAATTTLRVFVQATSAELVRAVVLAHTHVFMQHSSGLHGSLDLRSISRPLPFLEYYPAVVDQQLISEGVTIFNADGSLSRRHVVGGPRRTERLAARLSYDPAGPRPLEEFGHTRTVPFGDVILGRSGDKGANVNVGFTPRRRVNSQAMWEWLRSFLTIARLKQMMADDWRDFYHVERVEFPGIRAVHFVVYGGLGRGVTSSARLDALGKGFADWLRAVHVEVPVRFLSADSKL